MAELHVTVAAGFASRYVLHDFRREANDGRSAHPRPREPLELLRLRHQQRGCLRRAHNARGVRVEGQHDRRHRALGRDAGHPLQDLHVPAMQAVEIAQRQHGAPPARRTRIVGKVNDVH
jgi:hypothetical protein